MKLYHYSTAQYPVLLTRRKTGQPTPEGVNVSDNYLDHISFFFDPIPSRIMPEVFSKGHHFWFAGNRIFEHVIEVNELEDNIRYLVVESKREDELWNRSMQRKFKKAEGKDRERLLKEWHDLIASEKIRWGESGSGRHELKKQIRKNMGSTSLSYIAASTRDDFEDGYNKYAANVPHLMIYPSEGEVPVREVFELKIGSDYRKRV